MKKEIKTEIEICEDCYYYYHKGNDEFGHVIDSFNEKKNRAIFFKQLCEGFYLIDSYGENPCTICESHLAGNRYNMKLNIKK